ncbi:YadA C-terminal domain-containing protein [Moraxella catarrhalis]|nr:YadA C-terminal domain-containing protein [Moraxella catarrhalis]
MKLLPLKIAVTSAMIIGLGAASTANAQAQNNLRPLEIARGLVEHANSNFEKLKEDKNHRFKITMLMNQNATIAAVEDLDKDVEDLYEITNENLDRISQLDGLVFNNTQNIKDLDDEVGVLSQDIGSLHDDVADNQADIAANKTAIAKNQADIAKNQADIAKNKADIQTLENNVEEGLLDLSGRLLDQNADIAKNKADIQTLENNVGEELLNLSGRLLDQNADIKDLDDEVGVLSQDIGSLHDDVADNQADIAANKAAADAKFAATEDAITKHGQDINKNVTSIANLGTKVDGFDGRVTALDTKVNGFDGRISALDTKVNAFDGRITALDSKVENGMAAQAALSGLFQPYSVGKFNATAALGGYGSKSAVAIGAGYRVNPNLAFKAGAAINTSGDKKGSYNIGVNYEF